MKNPNKFGTCYKLSGKRRKPYIARAYTGKDEYGEPIYKTIGFYATKTEGQKALLEYNYNPYNIDSKKLTFSDIYSLWKESYLKDNPNSKTIKNYEKGYKLLKPLHKEKFCDIKGYHLQKEIDNLAEKYTRSYLDSVYILLNFLYNFAIKYEICDKNLTNIIKKKGKSKQEQEYFTQIEVAKIYKNIGIVVGTEEIIILCFTGIRVSELFNITKFNIDFKNNIIHGIGIKTESGKNKRIPISKYILPILKKRYEQTDNYLFSMPNGNKLNYQYFLKKIYKPCLEELNINYKTPKSTRHFFATFTNEIDMNSKARTSILGHTNIDFTNKTYTHVEDRFLQKEYTKVDENLSKLLKSLTKN